MTDFPAGAVSRPLVQPHNRCRDTQLAYLPQQNPALDAGNPAKPFTNLESRSAVFRLSPLYPWIRTAGFGGSNGKKM
jgi:hypothetical protein